MYKLDVIGLGCPHPCIEVKKEIDAGHLPLQVSVSVGAPRENVTRMAKSSGLNVCEKPGTEEGVYILELTKA
jgi:TusA-related sulfurtransferase